MKTCVFKHATFFLALATTLVLAQCVFDWTPVYPISIRIQNQLSGGHKLTAHCKSVYRPQQDFGVKLVKSGEAYTADYESFISWRGAKILCELSWESDNHTKHGGNYGLFLAAGSFVRDGHFPYTSNWAAKDDGLYVLNVEQKKSVKFYNWDK